MTGEVWKPIDGYEGLWEVSTAGRVRRISGRNYRGFRVASFGSKQSKGYMTISARKRGSRSTLSVHRCVAVAFIPNPYGLAEVNHINGDKGDNRVENLEWCDRSENLKHATANGLKRHKVNPTKVRIARRCLDLGITQRFVSSCLGIDQSAVSRIRNGQSWTHIKSDGDLTEWIAEQRE